MSSERLEELFFDDRNKLRVWKPEAEVRRTTRRTGAKNLARESDRELRKYVESERIKALGSSNSMAKQRGIQQHQTLIIEESTESEGFLCPTSIPMENRIGTTGFDRRHLEGNHKDGNLDRINRSAAR